MPGSAGSSGQRQTPMLVLSRATGIAASGGPSFDNQIGTLEFEGRKAHLRVERPRPGGGGPRLETVFEFQLA
jgi:hypothetical protein